MLMLDLGLDASVDVVHLYESHSMHTALQIIVLDGHL